MYIEGSRALSGIIVQANIGDDGAIDDKDTGMNTMQTDVMGRTYAKMVLMRREVLAWNDPVTGSSDVSISMLLACMYCRGKRQMSSRSSHGNHLRQRLLERQSL